MSLQMSNNDNISSSNDEVAAANVATKNYGDSSSGGAGPETVFDKILFGDLSSDKVYEDDEAMAFRDVNP